jgi:hypothetical protein
MSDDQPTGTRNPARYEGDEKPLATGPTPDSVASDDNVGRRAQQVNGAVVGAGAGAGGGGGPEEFDHDDANGGTPRPNHFGQREAKAGVTTGNSNT